MKHKFLLSVLLLSGVCSILIGCSQKESIVGEWQIINVEYEKGGSIDLSGVEIYNFLPDGTYVRSFNGQPEDLGKYEITEKNQIKLTFYKDYFNNENRVSIGEYKIVNDELKIVISEGDNIDIDETGVVTRIFKRVTEEKQ